MRSLTPLLETRCESCAVPVPQNHEKNSRTLCPSCEALLARREGGFCSRCGNLTALTASPPAPCGDCLAKERPWDRFFFHGVYQGLLRDLILRFKAGHELPLAGLLGALLAAHPGIPAAYDAVVPLPLHVRRLRERGFNQAAELARPIARRVNAPVLAALARTVDTHPQAGLSLEARKSNVRNIFAPTQDIAGRRLLLVDDIATTCATLESAVTALTKAGAASVDVAVVARTPEHGL
ncbi:ComF family protein [Desulfovibrio sp. OttesenSCG-928-O18]|nr:ComF family protein [Desulfovibrio sp. OttesenSCG-928-O18]